MSNLDLINAYFGNEMTEAEMLEFETKLQKDSELKKEFDFQNEVVSAIKEARRAELKAMLDKVPVGGAGGSTFSIGKIATSVAIIGLIALGVYFLWPGQTEETLPPQEEMSVATPAEEEIMETPQPEISEPIEVEEDAVASEVLAEEKAEVIEKTEEENVDPVEQVASDPVIIKPDLVPSFETREDVADSLEAPGSDLVTKPVDDAKSLNVEIDNTKKNFSFHYQFKSGKLFLYGSFDKGLYEILEINSKGKKNLFLYYKGKFYALDSDQQRIKSLEPIKDSSLIDKLEKARGEN